MKNTLCVLTFLRNDRWFMFFRSHKRTSSYSFTSSLFTFTSNWNLGLFYLLNNFWNDWNRVYRSDWFYIRVDEGFTEIFVFVWISWWKFISHWTARCRWISLTNLIILWKKVIDLNLIRWQWWLIWSFRQGTS